MLTQAQITIVGILLGTIVLFLWGRWRHDIVALGALLACVLTGLLPSNTAFYGFGHPAVVTVACVLILSSGLHRSGAINVIAQRILPQSGDTFATTAILILMAAVLSAFMNNVAALALLMPIGIQIAKKRELPPSKILLPLSFGSILGGMMTVIGTPPNLIVADFRAEIGRSSFTMFDFTPVGAVVALVGIIFIILIGGRLVPGRKGAGSDSFEIDAYLTELRVSDEGNVVGMRLRELESQLLETDARVIGIVRGENRILAPNAFRKIRAGDILIIQAEPTGLASALSSLNLKFEESVPEVTDEETTKEESAAPVITERDQRKIEESPDGGNATKTSLQSKEVLLMEFVVLPNSELVGRTATDFRLRTHYGINLLAISRQGQRSLSRLRKTIVKTGDVLLMQGSPDSMAEFGAQFGCVPLAERQLHIPDKRNALLATGIMVAAICGASFGLVSTAIAFATAVLFSVVLGVVPLRTIYKVVDWPVIVLLGAMIPVAGVLDTTGAGDLIARFLLDNIAGGHPLAALTLILVVSMTLSDFMNNAATAALMCPIALGTAERIGANPDAFLMAVAIGASCAFLTPIGHQNNTLILGPAGLKFSDYWRLGLPLEALVVVTAVPMISIVWPLFN